MVFISKRLFLYPFFFSLTLHPVLASEVFKTTIVGIESQTEWGVVRGSGVIVATGLIATDCRIVSDSSSIDVILGDQRRAGTIKYENRLEDVCLLAAPNTGSQIASFRSGHPVEVGEPVLAIGISGVRKNLTESDGKIIALIEKDKVSAMRASSPMIRGLSGGGVFDQNGHLVGLTYYPAEVAGGASLILPVGWVEEAISALAKNATHGSEPYTLTIGAFNSAITSLHDESEACQKNQRCAGTPENSSELSGNSGWPEAKAREVAELKYSDGTPVNLDPQVIVAESRRAGIDPDLTLAMIEGFDSPFRTFEGSPAAGPLWIGAINLQRMAELPGFDLQSSRSVLESPIGNLRAGLSALRTYLDSTGQNPYLAVHAYILFAVGLPEIFAIRGTQRVTEKWRSLKPADWSLP